MTTKKISLQITLYGDNATAETLDREINTMMQYLKNSHLGVSTSQIKKSNESEPGVKGDPFTWGALLLVAAPTVLPQILAFIEKIVIEGRKIEVQAPNGAKIVFVPNKKMTPKESMKFIKELNKITPTK